MQALFDEIHPVFQKNDHTAAELLLYPQGFQQDTPSADNEIFTALAGDPFKPGIEGFLPELSAGLYITNGDFTDWAYNIKGTLSFTPEGTQAEDPNVTGFEYPDSEQQIQQEFRRHLPFALDLAKSADDPSEPDSHLDNTADDFVVDTFAESYGDPQPVGGGRQAQARRRRRSASRSTAAPTLVAPTKAYAGGERYYKDPGVYYQRVPRLRRRHEAGRLGRGVVHRGRQGVGALHVLGGGRVQQARADPVQRGLLRASSPNRPVPGPKYLHSYTAALDAAGVSYDVYDVDAHGRRAPDPLGILAHYSHVVWYTGDDYVPREPDAPGGSGMTKMAVDTQNAVRDFINDGGKLFFTGKNAGRVFAEALPVQPVPGRGARRTARPTTPTRAASPSRTTSCSTTSARTATSAAAARTTPDDPFPVQGTFGPVHPLSFDFNGPDSAQNNDHTATLLTTSSVLPPAQFPLYADSKAVAAWQRPVASPFNPHDGNWFLSAGTDDQAYKRLLKTVHDPGRRGTVKFWTSFDLEQDYDYMFVEIHTVAGDGRLDDARGRQRPHERRRRPVLPDDAGGVGSAWQTNHPFLAHYQTVAPGDDCDPTGTTGEWNAATGNSGGWQEWSLPIPAAYARRERRDRGDRRDRPGTLGLGTWVDELRVVDAADAPINTADPSFETRHRRLDAARSPGPAGPAGQSDATGWERAQSAPFVEAPIVTTTDTVYTGFAFEAVTGAANRNALMQAVLTHLGAPTKPAFDAPTPEPENAAAATTATAATTTTAAAAAVRPAQMNLAAREPAEHHDRAAQRRAGDARLQPALRGPRRPRRQPRDAAGVQAAVAADRAAHGDARAGAEEVPRPDDVDAPSGACARARNMRLSVQATWSGVSARDHASRARSACAAKTPGRGYGPHRAAARVRPTPGVALRSVNGANDPRYGPFSPAGDVVRELGLVRRGGALLAFSRVADGLLGAGLGLAVGRARHAPALEVGAVGGPAFAGVLQ